MSHADDSVRYLAATERNLRKLAANTTPSVTAAAELAAANAYAAGWHAARDGRSDTNPILVLADQTTERLARIIAEDAVQWPHGHPCRDCNRLADEHPVKGCGGWR